MNNWRKMAMTVALLTLCAGAALAGSGKTLDPSPGSLDDYYPPKAPGPVYLLEMLKLEGAFSGIVAEVMEDDMEGAKALYTEFSAYWEKMRDMVPEWAGLFPSEGVEAIGRALGGPDKGAVFAAVDSVGEACHHCHAEAMVAAQQKYRWGDFSAFTFSGQKDGEKIPFNLMKKMISAGLAGVAVDARQGQLDRATGHLSRLDENYAAFTSICIDCHAEKPDTFNDASALEALKAELAKQAPSAERVGELLGEFGRRNCSGCHMVHVPAAMARSKGQ